MESVLEASELECLSAAMDEVADRVRKARGLDPNDSLDLRNAVARHEAIADLLDHPRILPLVVDAMGWNIQNRDSIFDYKAPQPGAADPDVLSLGWHFDYELTLRSAAIFCSLSDTTHTRY